MFLRKTGISVCNVYFQRNYMSSFLFLFAYNKYEIKNKVFYIKNLFIQKIWHFEKNKAWILQRVREEAGVRATGETQHGTKRYALPQRSPEDTPRLPATPQTSITQSSAETSATRVNTPPEAPTGGSDSQLLPRRCSSGAFRSGPN